MRVRFWGVRGAIASTRGDSQGVGGNTVCVEVRDGSDELVVLDAGIGLYWLGRTLLTGPHGRGQGRVTLLLSHTHWDHIQGIPFFVPVYLPGNVIDVYGGGVDHLEPILEGQLNPTYSPIVSLSNMGAKVVVGELTDTPLSVGGLSIQHASFTNGPHQIVGYRIEEEGRSLCYIPEVEHSGGLTPAVLELARGADVLIHEAYYTNEELAGGGISLAGPSGPTADGHTSFGLATDLALAAGVKRLYYFYHHPDHDDATVDAAVAAERERISAGGHALLVDAAREGVEFDV